MSTTPNKTVRLALVWNHQSGISGLAKLLFLACSALSLGATCTPAPQSTVPYDQVSELSIESPAASWSRTITNHQSAGWTQGGLFPVSDYMNYPSKWSEGRMTGKVGGPRDLILFSDWNSYEAVTLMKTMQYASAPPNYSMLVPWQVASARFVDHGKCRLVAPFPMLFARINNALSAKIFATMTSKSASVTNPRQVSGDFQARFVVEYGDGGTPDDGFFMSGEFTASIPLFPNPTLSFQKAYRIFLKDGFPAVAMVSGGSTHAEHTGTPWAAGNKADVVSEGQLLAGLRDDLPAQLREMVLKGNPAASPDPVPGLSIPTGQQCNGSELGYATEDRDSICRGKADDVRKSLHDYLTDSKVVSEQEAADIVNALPAANFLCGAPDQYDNHVCIYRPRFRRVAVLPDRLELIWYEDSELETPDSKLFRNLAGSAYGSCDAFPALDPKPVPITHYPGR